MRGCRARLTGSELGVGDGDSVGSAISGPFSKWGGGWWCPSEIPRYLKSESAADMWQGWGLAWGAPSRRRHRGSGRGRLRRRACARGVWLMLAGACEGTSYAACFSQPRP